MGWECADGGVVRLVRITGEVWNPDSLLLIQCSSPFEPQFFHL